MSDQTLAAAIMMSAVLKKMTLPDDADVDKEALRLFRRYSAIIARAANKRSSEQTTIPDHMLASERIASVDNH